MLGARGSSRSWRWAALLPLACCLSCSQGPVLNPVTGKVLYKGEPLAGVLVSFHPEVEDMNVNHPTGLTKEDGTFSVTTGDVAGAPLGKYVITFSCSTEVDRPQGKAVTMTMGPEYEDRFKGAYAEKSKSKFQAEVKPGPNQLDTFKLD